MSIFTIQEILEDLVVQRTLLERYIFNKWKENYPELEVNDL